MKTGQKILVALVGFLVIVLAASGAPITQDQALRAANTFITVTYPTSVPGTVKTTRVSGKSARAVQDIRPLVEAGQAIGYVADLDGSGYVLLSTDDEAPPVKCHTEDGNFDQLPPGFLAVLKSELAEDLFVLAQLKSTKGKASQITKRSPTDYKTQWEALLNPLPQTQKSTPSKAFSNTVLLTTEWGQGDPYNHDCPSASGGPDGRAPAGCVNVALAQILRFWEHPNAVVSNHEYRDDEGSCTGTHSISDEGMGDYNWTDMRDSAYPSSSLARRRAVGQLIYHIAVAMESDFESDSTGASSSDVPDVLREYFNFTCDDFVGKNSDTSSEWFSKIRADIQADKPIYYVMRKPGSLGHALVCDGYSYNLNKEIHLNFGWSDESRNTWYNINSVSVNGYAWTWYGAVFEITPNQSELAFRRFTIDDDDSGGSDGNDDGVVNPGEEIELLVSLRNTGDGTAHDVEGILSTSDRYVDITDEDVRWGDISAGTTDEGIDFDFEIDSDCPAGREIDFTLDITADEGSWTERFTIIVDAYPDLTNTSHRIDDDNSGSSSGNDDGKVNPGEKIEMPLTLQNTGLGDANGVEAVLSTTDPYITITDDDIRCRSISAGTRDEGVDFDYLVANDCPIGHQITFNLAITSDEGSWNDSSFQVPVVAPPQANISIRDLQVSRPANSTARNFSACRFELYNHGPATDIGTVRVEFYLSRDRTFGDGDDRKIGDTRLTGITIPEGRNISVVLGPSRRANMARFWTSELAGEGLFYVYARATALTAGATQLSSNRVRTTSRFRYTFPRVDLAIQKLRMVRPGNAVLRRFNSCRFHIVNRGAALRSATVGVHFYLSRDKTFGNADDRKIGDTRIRGLSISARSVKSLTLGSRRRSSMVRLWTQSLAPRGYYYLFARVSPITARETRWADNVTRASTRFPYSNRARSSTARLNKAAGLENSASGPTAWARSGEGDWTVAPELLDGTDSGWTGEPTAGPWAVALDLGETILLSDLGLDAAEDLGFNVGMLGTEDLVEWFDLESITNWPIPCRAVFFDFHDDGAGEAPAIQEIRWEEE